MNRTLSNPAIASALLAFGQKGIKIPDQKDKLSFIITRIFPHANILTPS
jgi:hypothetical protein